MPDFVHSSWHTADLIVPVDPTDTMSVFNNKRHRKAVDEFDHSKRKQKQIITEF